MSLDQKMSVYGPWWTDIIIWKKLILNKARPFLKEGTVFVGWDCVICFKLQTVPAKGVKFTNWYLMLLRDKCRESPINDHEHVPRGCVLVWQYTGRLQTYSKSMITETLRDSIHPYRREAAEPFWASHFPQPPPPPASHSLPQGCSQCNPIPCLPEKNSKLEMFRTEGVMHRTFWRYCCSLRCFW